MRDAFRRLVYLGQNPISLAGAALTTAAAFTLIFFWVHESLSDRPTSAYVGLLVVAVLPALFVAGLLVMPVGVVLQRRRLVKEGHLPTVYPEVHFGDPTIQRALTIVSGLTVINLALVGTATYRAHEYMDSREFCGTVCHTVMMPEYGAYLDSPHSRIACVDCHIGPGASWFVKSKLDGLRQVWAMARRSYSRPIPSPVHELRPARETCEQCHWPQKFHGDKLVVKVKYAEDEANSPLTTVLLLHLGGRQGSAWSGIHGRHLNDAARITYEGDHRRETIAQVNWTDDAGKQVAFASDKAKVEGETETRDMDCVDCHNRPTHAFETPERAVDRALREGKIARDLPFAKKTGVALIKADYPDTETAQAKIRDGLAAFYKEKYPAVSTARAADIAAAATALQAAWGRNVFPNMRLTWGSHPNHIGHDDTPGCFRCHDNEHKAADGRAIPGDCETCHSVLAMEEADPEILAKLGVR